jgi:hypothetical protein
MNEHTTSHGTKDGTMPDNCLVEGADEDGDDTVFLNCDGEDDDSGWEIMSTVQEVGQNEEQMVKTRRKIVLNRALCTNDIHIFL